MSAAPWSGASTQNSSPPMRAAVSTERMVRRTASAMCDEHAVAGRASTGVVDPREAVQVEHQQGEAVAVALVQRHGLGEDVWRWARL